MHSYQLRELLIIHNLVINVYQDSRACNFSIAMEKETEKPCVVWGPMTADHVTHAA